jgi:hypothetical protein
MERAQPAAGQESVAARAAARCFRLASPRIAAALAVLVVLLAGASVPLYAVTHQDVLANGGENIALAVIFGSVGLVIAWRQPHNPIGWLMLAGPALALLSIDGTLYAALTYRPGRRWSAHGAKAPPCFYSPSRPG